MELPVSTHIADSVPSSLWRGYTKRQGFTVFSGFSQLSFSYHKVAQLRRRPLMAVNVRYHSWATLYKTNWGDSKTNHRFPFGGGWWKQFRYDVKVWPSNQDGCPGHKGSVMDLIGLLNDDGSIRHHINDAGLILDRGFSKCSNTLYSVPPGYRKFIQQDAC